MSLDLAVALGIVVLAGALTVLALVVFVMGAGPGTPRPLTPGVGPTVTPTGGHDG